MMSQYAMSDDEHAEQIQAFISSNKILDGTEGWEYWRGFGEMHHVYAMKFQADGKVKRVRFIGPAHSPFGFNPRSEKQIQV